ncbi:MAG: hypothetical protein K6L81_02040 [Agarilytica sp.]
MDNIYVLPSIFALALKAVIFWQARSRLSNACVIFITFLVAIFIANAIEFSGFAYFNYHVEYALIPLIAYYFALITAAFAMLGLSLSSVGRLSLLVVRSLLFTWACLGVAMFFPGFVVADVESINYSLTRVPGPGYIIGPLAFLVPNLIAFCILIYGIVFRAGHKRARCVLLLLALLPLIMTLVIVSTLMANGVPINMTIYFSFASIVSVGVLVSADGKFYGFSLLSTIKGTREHEFAKIVNKAYDEYLPLDKATHLFEYAVVLRALAQFHGDEQEACRVLGISRSTLQRKIKRGKDAEEGGQDRSLFNANELFKENPGMSDECIGKQEA